MNELTRFTQTINRWQLEHSKTNSSYQIKRNILKDYYGLGKKTLLSDIAKDYRVTVQYVRQVIRDIEIFLKLEKERCLFRLKASLQSYLDQIVFLKVMPLATALIHLKALNIVPTKVSPKQFEILLKRLGLSPNMIEIGKQKYCIEKSSWKDRDIIRRQLNDSKKKLVSHLKKCLILTSTQIQQILSITPAQLKCLVIDKVQFVVHGDYVIYNWRNITKRTDFSYLLAKVFAVYQYLSLEDLACIVSKPSRTTIDYTFLKGLTKEQIKLGLQYGGLIHFKDGVCFGNGDPACVTEKERHIVEMIKNIGRLKASHLAKVCQQQGWSAGSQNALLKSALLKRTNNLWFDLYPHVFEK